MNTAQTSTFGARYSLAYQAIHWLTALLMIAVVVLGVYCGSLTPGTQPRRWLLEIHKSIGLTILALSVLRLLARAFIKAPPYPNGMSAWQKVAAGLGHAALYAILFYMPLTGYVSSAAGGYPLSWFGLAPVPRLLPLDKQVAHVGEAFHIVGQWALYAVFALHLGATLWHQFIEKDRILSRMLPGRPSTAAESSA